MFNKIMIIGCVFVAVQEVYAYSDPVTELIDCLCIKYDFEQAQEKLKECEKVSFLGLFFYSSM